MSLPGQGTISIRKSFIVYKVTSPCDKVYIGITSTSLKKRKERHFNDSKRKNYKFSKAIRSYGDLLKWEVLYYVDSWEEACRLEKFFIDKFNSFNNGYNSTLGGEGSYGLKISKESKLKMSNAKKGKPLHPNSIKALRKRMSENHPRLGVRLSEETKNKISESHKGKVYTEERKTTLKKSIRDSIARAVVCFDMEGNLIKEFNCVSDVNEWLNKKHTSAVNACCKGKRETAYGYKWKYKEDI